MGVEDVAGERQVQGGVGRVHRRFISFPDCRTVVIEKDHEFSVT